MMATTGIEHNLITIINKVNWIHSEYGSTLILGVTLISKIATEIGNFRRF